MEEEEEKLKEDVLMEHFNMWKVKSKPTCHCKFLREWSLISGNFRFYCPVHGLMVDKGE